MKLTVKRWIADKAQVEAKIYNYFFNVIYVNGYYADVENDTVTFADVEVIRETEKAINISVSCGAIDGKIGAWKMWVPKSQIIV